MKSAKIVIYGQLCRRLMIVNFIRWKGDNYYKESITIVNLILLNSLALKNTVQRESGNAVFAYAKI